MAGVQYLGPMETAIACGVWALASLPQAWSVGGRLSAAEELGTPSAFLTFTTVER